MEVPGLAELSDHAPSAARRLETFVRRLVGGIDADRWATDQIRALVEGHARGDVLGELVSLVRAEAGTDEVWAVLWTGDPADGGLGFGALAGHGQAPPDPSGLSRTLLTAVARRARAVWLDEGNDGGIGAAPSIIGSEIQPHGAVPIGRRGALYLAGSDAPRALSSQKRLRIEALCRIAGGFVDAAPDRRPPTPTIPGMIGTSRPMVELARTLHERLREVMSEQ